jgi:DNA-binding transcriptional MerR regulator
MTKYSIGQFSKLSNLSIDTLRYYEKQELIFPKRDQANRRFYTDHDLPWIDFIHRLKKTGMPIKKMREYTKLRYEGNSTIPDRILILNKQLATLQFEEKRLQEHIRFVEEKIETYNLLLLRNIVEHI